MERHAGNARPRVTYSVKAREDQCHRDELRVPHLPQGSPKHSEDETPRITEDPAQAGLVNSWWCKEDLGRWDS